MVLVVAPVHWRRSAMLRAYLDPISVGPGDRVQVMVSTDAPTYRAEVVRLLHGDPNPEGPGVLEQAMDWLDPQEPHPGQEQPLRLGSWIELPAADPWPASFSLTAWVYPTAHTGRLQVIASWADDNNEVLRLEIGEDWCLHGALRVGETVHRVSAPAEIRPRRWHFLGISYDSETRLLGTFSAARGASIFAVNRVPVLDSTVEPAAGPLLIGAQRCEGATLNAFNGKVGGVSLYNSALDDIDLTDLKNGAPPRGPRCEGAWDYSREIYGNRIVDVSGRGRHGVACNGPTRGVTGPNWRGSNDTVYAAAPEQYDAVHLHEDDLKDANWTPTCDFNIPAEARSGIYAVRIRAGLDSETLSFVVRVGEVEEVERAEILFVVPTFTWLAYANFDASDKHDIGLSLYDNHSDGTANYYATWRKPTSSTRPDLYFEAEEGGGAAPKLDPTSQGMEEKATHLVMADLYIIHWLEHLGVTYHVIADDDLHRRGTEALLPYAVVVSAGHHEYWTPQMLDAMDTYLEAGGHLQYMSGNGLYWATSLHPQHPHLMEVRRRGGTATSEAEAGELQHSSTGLLGGTWSDQGRAPQQLVGVGMAGQGFSQAPGFHRLTDSYDPRAEFIFEGVGVNEVIGDFGLNLRGAGGFEFDRIDRAEGTPSDALLLASTIGPPETYYRAMEHGVGRGPHDPLVRGDMTYFERGCGGAVFSVGSITWSGSLSYRDYENNVARISTNVLCDFVRRGPPGESS